MKTCALLIVIPTVVAVLMLGWAPVQVSMAQQLDVPEEKSTEEAVHKKAAVEPSLSEIDRQLNNILSSLWSLVLQDNLNLKSGDWIDGRTEANSFYFQPALPIPVGREKESAFIARPVFPFVTNPKLRPTSPDGVDGHVTGLGDIQLLSLVGPNRKEGLVWGVGATFKFPTASDETLGQGKFQAGPAGMLSLLTDRWSLGMIAQQWSSYAGDNNRPETSQTDIAYTIVRHLPGAWSLGMTPTVSIDWKADGSNNLTLPIGMGLGRVIRIGKLPVKIRFEVQYSVIHPDSFGTEWNFRLQIVPVIPNPFR